MPELGEVTHAHFEELEERSFTLEVGGESRDVELVAVDVREPVHDLPHTRTPFSLVFRGGEDLDIPRNQGICTLRHPDMGELDLFVVMIGPDEEGRQRIQAVFN